MTTSPARAQLDAGIARPMAERSPRGGEGPTTFAGSAPMAAAPSACSARRFEVGGSTPNGMSSCSVPVMQSRPARPIPVGPRRDRRAPGRRICGPSRPRAPTFRPMALAGVSMGQAGRLRVHRRLSRSRATLGLDQTAASLHVSAPMVEVCCRPRQLREQQQVNIMSVTWPTTARRCRSLPHDRSSSEAA